MPTLNWIGKDAVVKHHQDVPLRLPEPTITHASKLAFVSGWLSNLLVQPHFDLGRANLQKFLLRQMLDACIRELRREAVNRVQRYGIFDFRKHPRPWAKMQVSPASGRRSGRATRGQVARLHRHPKEYCMPTYHVEMMEGRTIEQKKKLVAEITRVSVEVLGGSPDSVDILITDVKRENWATGGILWSEPRA